MQAVFFHEEETVAGKPCGAICGSAGYGAEHGRRLARGNPVGEWPKPAGSDEDSTRSMCGHCWQWWIEGRYRCAHHDVLHGGPILENVDYVSTLLTHRSVHGSMLLQRRYKEQTRYENRGQKMG